MKQKHLQDIAAICVVLTLSACVPELERRGDVGGTEGGLETQAPQSVSISLPAYQSYPKVTARAGQVYVIDGDTIAMSELRVRLHGIDAPELSQTCKDQSGQVWACGHWAKSVLEDMLKSDVSCFEQDVDRYGRSVATCFSGAANLNAMMVEQGAAYAYTQYSSDYVAVERTARERTVGLWASSGQTPAQYRASQGAARVRVNVQASTAVAQGCAIKGNISSSGHVYHMPGSHWYSRTSINEGSGERWFCSEREAQAAGWRAAR
jgi:endonuclease YncB( thermonuclease family)